MPYRPDGDERLRRQAPIASAIPWVFVAHIRLLTRPLARAYIGDNHCESDSQNR